MKTIFIEKKGIQYIFLVFFISLTLTNQAQENKYKKIDSLLNIYASTTDKNKLDICIKIADEYKHVGATLSAIDYLKEALTYNVDNNLKNSADINIKIGHLAKANNQHLEALKYYLKGIDFLKKEKRHEDIVIAYLHVSDLFYSISQYGQAKKYIFQAEAIYNKERLNIDTLNYHISNMQGVLFYYIGQLDSARKYYQNAYELSIRMKDVKKTAMSLSNLAMFYSENNDYNTALKYYFKVYEVLKGGKNYYRLGIAKRNIANTYYLLKDYTTAEKYLIDAIEDIKKDKKLSELAGIYDDLSKNYEAMGKIEDAYKYHKLFDKINDSLITAETLKNLNDFENQYELQRFNNENKMLSEQNKFNFTQKIFLLIFIGLIILIGGLIYRNLRISLKNTKLKEQILRKETEKLGKELDYKGQELETFAHKIIQKNEILEKLNVDINKIKDKNAGDENLKEIFQNISDNLYIGKENMDLENQLQIIQETFVLRLKEKYGSLSKTEIKICSMLLLGLSTKDISTTLNISYESAKKHRHRIRQKLGLLFEEDLEDFLKKV